MRIIAQKAEAIVGFAKACELCADEMKVEGARQIILRDKLINELKKIKNLTINGPDNNQGQSLIWLLRISRRRRRNYLKPENMILCFMGIHTSRGSRKLSSRVALWEQFKGNP